MYGLAARSGGRKSLRRQWNRIQIVLLIKLLKHGASVTAINFRRGPYGESGRPVHPNVAKLIVKIACIACCVDRSSVLYSGRLAKWQSGKY